MKKFLIIFLLISLPAFAYPQKYNEYGTKFTIDSSTGNLGITTGNIGIGTSSPGSALDVRGVFTISKQGGAPGSAPGAGLCFIFSVAGTNANTCKIQAMCGTSTTPVTITDNIGSGC